MCHITNNIRTYDPLQINHPNKYNTKYHHDEENIPQESLVVRGYRGTHKVTYYYPN